MIILCMATKHVDTFQEVLNYARKMADFQSVHNELSKDYSILESITLEQIKKGISSPQLIRSCIKELFSLIEADIFLMNVFEPYKDYADNQDFFTKFKKTFRSHCSIHNTMSKFDQFMRKHYSTLRLLKAKRDQITHPKGEQSIFVDVNLFSTNISFARSYSDFVSSIMTDVWVSTKVSSIDLLNGFLTLDNK